MQFIKVADGQPAISSFANRLQSELAAGKRVLWLVSGGSNIAASVVVMARLPPELTANLQIMLSDERYGPIGHADSNAAQLLAAGFDHQQATVLPVLMPDLSFEDTRQRYALLAMQAFRDADIVIAQCGIGPDGHIAGILPDSPALTSPDFVAGYSAPPYQRLTLTSHALKRVNVDYSFVFGADKLATLQRLHDETLAYSEQPSQILKELPEAYVYNDQIGDETA